MELSSSGRLKTTKPRMIFQRGKRFARICHSGRRRPDRLGRPVRRAGDIRSDEFRIRRLAQLVDQITHYHDTHSEPGVGVAVAIVASRALGH